jgi:hypothetical protein
MHTGGIMAQTMVVQSYTYTEHSMDQFDLGDGMMQVAAGYARVINRTQLTLSTRTPSTYFVCAMVKHYIINPHLSIKA